MKRAALISAAIRPLQSVSICKDGRMSVRNPDGIFPMLSVSLDGIFPYFPRFMSYENRLHPRARH